MRSITTSAHIEPETTARVQVFDGTDHGDCFISLRLGGDLVDIALIARPESSEALRLLARAAEEAAYELDRMAADDVEGAA
ncbi:hypothetical protein [Streptomyces shenzhenensis]|uniref:hypothetical protein n=1 Tax=Streptomyces shenzhenensis TaxID=943815 RepID=UPI001F35D712|nr:hypothetical protein [Streptomyces shenzhenensis]